MIPRDWGGVTATAAAHQPLPTVEFGNFERRFLIWNGWLLSMVKFAELKPVVRFNLISKHNIKIHSPSKNKKIKFKKLLQLFQFMEWQGREQRGTYCLSSSFRYVPCNTAEMLRFFYLHFTSGNGGTIARGLYCYQKHRNIPFFCVCTVFSLVCVICKGCGNVPY